MTMRSPRRIKQENRTPQECPLCRVSLADPDVPKKFEKVRHLFTLALSIEATNEWQCPVCLHRWRRR